MGERGDQRGGLVVFLLCLMRYRWHGAVLLRAVGRPGFSVLHVCIWRIGTRRGVLRAMPALIDAHESLVQFACDTCRQSLFSKSQHRLLKLQHRPLKLLVWPLGLQRLHKSARRPPLSPPGRPASVHWTPAWVLWEPAKVLWTPLRARRPSLRSFRYKKKTLC